MTWPAWALAMLPWAKEKAWPFLLAHWKDLGVVAAVVLAFLFWRQGGQLSECRAALSVKSDTYQAQSSSATAKAQGVIIARPGPARPCPAQGLCPPCPEFEVHFGAEGGAVQNQSQTASTAPASASRAPVGGLWLGGQYLSTPQKAYGLATAKFQQGSWSAGGGVGADVWQVGVEGRILAW